MRISFIIHFPTCWTLCRIQVCNFCSFFASSFHSSRSFSLCCKIFLNQSYYSRILTYYCILEMSSLGWNLCPILPVNLKGSSSFVITAISALELHGIEDTFMYCHFDQACLLFKIIFYATLDMLIISSSEFSRLTVSCFNLAFIF